MAQRHVALGLGDMLEAAHFDGERIVAVLDQRLDVMHPVPPRRDARHLWDFF